MHHRFTREKSVHLCHKFIQMTISGVKEKIQVTQQEWDDAMNYVEYRSLISDLLENDLVTGETQSEALLDYTKLNVQRMNRWDKHFVPSSEMEDVVKGISDKRYWVFITEGWCGDASQIIPAVEKISALNSRVKTKYFLRDQHDVLMQHYLTNGTKSVPKLICLNENKEVLWHWGPRPAGALSLLKDAKAEGLDAASQKERLHLWYARNKQMDLQTELIQLVESE